MADDRSLSELQTELKEKQDQLAQLRVDRAQAQQEAQEGVYKAQLAAEIERVNLDISTEETLLDVQQNIDSAQVGAGVVTVADSDTATESETAAESDGEQDKAPEPLPTADPQPTDTGEAQPSIQPETTPGNQPGDSDQPAQPNTNEEGNV